MTLPAVPCLGLTDFDPSRRSSRCSFLAEYSAEPEGLPVCYAHAFDYTQLRDLAPIDAERAACADCRAIADETSGLSRKEQRRRSARGELRSRWCAAHRRTR